MYSNISWCDSLTSLYIRCKWRLATYLQLLYQKLTMNKCDSISFRTLSTVFWHCMSCMAVGCTIVHIGCTLCVYGIVHLQIISDTRLSVIIVQLRPISFIGYTLYVWCLQSRFLHCYFIVRIACVSSQGRMQRRGGVRVGGDGGVRTPLQQLATPHHSLSRGLIW